MTPFSAAPQSHSLQASALPPPFQTQFMPQNPRARVGDCKEAYLPPVPELAPAHLPLPGVGVATVL